MSNIFMPRGPAIPIVARPGDVVSLPNYWTQLFGSNAALFPDVWLYNYGIADFQQNRFSYWSPASADFTRWLVNGNDTGTSEVHVASNGSSVVVDVGNSIAAYLVATVPIGTGTPPWNINTTYRVPVVDPAVLAPDVALGLPDPSDIVASAYRYAAYYGTPLNAADCYNIAISITAAAGATMPIASGSFNPAENLEGGFWRIAYRGSDHLNDAAPLHTLVRAGDVLRLQWINGTPDALGHTTTVLSVNPNGSITVYDNSNYLNGQYTVGIHTWNIDDAYIPGSLTIYRLSPDHLYLIEGTSNAEILAGSEYSDLIRGNGSADRIYSERGNDQIYVVGLSGTIVDGGAGFDTLHVAGMRAAIQSAMSISNVERVFYNDALVAFDTNGNAGDAYRIYQAAFDRTPDRPGLSYWVNQMDDGMPLSQVALNFILSPEFAATYGNINTMSNAQFVNVVYQNVLHRAPDMDGFSYWMNDLSNGYPRHNMLAAFSQSAENQANVATAIQIGILLDPGAFV